MGDKLITRPVSIEDNTTQKNLDLHQFPKLKCGIHDPNVQTVKTIQALKHKFHWVFSERIQVCSLLR
jgi:hypothetical protein